MKQNLSKILSALAILVAVSVSGCGGGGDDETTSALTKAEYIKQADAICKAQNKKKDAELRKAYQELEKNPQSGKAAEEGIIEVALPPIAQMTEEVADLGIPSEQGGEAKKFIEEMEAAVSEVEGDPKKALEGEPFGGAKKRATRFGFKQCNNF